MKRVLLYPDDSSAAPLPGSSSPDDALPDFRRWLAAVQSGLHTAPGEPDARFPSDDHSSREGRRSPDFPAQEGVPGQHS